MGKGEGIRGIYGTPMAPCCPLVVPCGTLPLMAPYFYQCKQCIEDHVSHFIFKICGILKAI